jgi:hypothetical protein
MSILLKALYEAFRKAKVDFFYSNNENYEDLLIYEENIHENLKKLESCIISRQLPETSSNCNRFYIGKKYEDKENTYSFRIMANPSFDIHVLSSYWLQTVGNRVDNKFTDGIVFGNRMRRCRDKSLNSCALGNFMPYSRQYQEWQGKAIETIEKTLEMGIQVSVFTTDITAFYHNVSPEVLYSKEFNGEYLKEPTDESIHFLFAQAISNWSKEAGDIYDKNNGFGLPVGLPASGIVANWILQTLDQEIEEKIRPIYYGRYVDDIILIVPKTDKVSKREDFCSWISERIQCLNYEKDELVFSRDFNSDDSDHHIPKIILTFGKDKQQYQEFCGARGKAQLQIFKQQTYERTSEWRALPELPPSGDRVLSKVLELTDKSSVRSIFVKDIEKLTIVKSRFVFMLRDFESIARILPPKVWSIQRKAFLSAYADYLITQEEFFTYEKYLYRVISLGVLCLDYQAVAHVLSCLENFFMKISDKDTKIKIAGNGFFPLSQNLKSKVLSNYLLSVRENIKNLIMRSNPNFQINKLFDQQELGAYGIFYSISNTVLNDSWGRYFKHDLAIFPYKSVYLPDYLNPMVLFDINENNKEFPKLLTKLKKLKSEGYSEKNIANIGVGFVFPTRPFSPEDLSFVFIENGSKHWDGNDFFPILELMRGYHRVDGLNQISYSENSLKVPANTTTLSIPIGLVCWKMSESDVEDLIKDTINSDKLAQRYSRFVRLMNQILSSKETPKYVVLPELAIPSRWFVTAARKLFSKKICLVSGIEYLQSKSVERLVSNEIWTSLDHNVFQFPCSFIYRQQKQYPAFGEVESLRSWNNTSFSPSEPSASNWPPVIQHGDFFFSLLVCSELLNIHLRSHLVGKIDALIASEWNKDIITYNSLVESAAMDLHAYIIQCNNNKYGDCRIRGPLKREYERDILKSKGGENDYFLIGKIDVLGLRDFHNNFFPALDTDKSVNFKPFPVGFIMSKERNENLKVIKGVLQGFRSANSAFGGPGLDKEE